MKRLFKHTAAFVIALSCFALAAFFRFALIGYSTMALMFAFFGGVILLYLLFTRVLRIILTLVLLAGVFLFISAEAPVIRAAGGDAGTEADYIIVLGAGVNGSVPSLSMVNRLTAALEYLEAHPDCKAVVTGGQGPGETVTEAEAMADWLTAHGIGAERIIPEPRAENTRENLEYSFALIPDASKAAIAVVSSEYHLYRAELMARTMGYRVSGIPAETTLPLLKVNYFIREALGVVHYKLLGT